ncbi:MAG: efflux transporter outer membrane subunit [Gammaproteobacteria bacterium]
MVAIRRRTATLLAGAVFAGGCITVGPDYEPPEIVVADQWHQALVANLSSEETTARWWLELEDPLLTGLVERAQRGSLGLEAAVARVEEARRLLDVVAGNRVPDVNLTGGVRRSRSTLAVLPGIDPVDDFSELSVGASWELDFWGRVRRSVESAQATYEASVEAYRDVLVILNAEVAGGYVFLRTLQERLRLAEENVERQRETLRLVEARNRAELAPELEVQQARLNLATTEAAIPALKTAVQQTINNLSTLVGEQPGALAAELVLPRPIPRPPESLAAGIPADAIRNRPDVRRAERALAAQTARIGVATSALYPNFSLEGAFGYSAVGRALLDDDNETWSIGPVFLWNLFDGGRVRGSIAVEEARTRQALAAYEASVLEALRDTENSLVAVANELERLAALRRSVDAASRSAELVRTLYRSGLTDFQNVLDTERALFNQQDLAARSQGEVVQNVISVYRAIGGGWSAATPVPGTEDAP